MGEMINTFRIFVGKPERKRPLRCLTLRWEDNIKMDLEQIGHEGVNWIHLDMLLKLRVPEGGIS
jgi:hypothetical protein